MSSSISLPVSVRTLGARCVSPEQTMEGRGRQTGVVDAPGGRGALCLLDLHFGIDVDFWFIRRSEDYREGKKRDAMVVWCAVLLEMFCAVDASGSRGWFDDGVFWRGKQIELPLTERTSMSTVLFCITPLSPTVSCDLYLHHAERAGTHV